MGKRLFIVLGMLFLLSASVIVLVYIFKNEQFLCRKNIFFPNLIQNTTQTYLQQGDGRSFLQSEACLVDVTPRKDPYFGDTAYRFKIGFFDKFGWLHIYEARIGAANKDIVIRPVYCVQDKAQQVCKNLPPKTLLATLKKGDVYRVKFIYQDNVVWQGKDLTTKYDFFLHSLYSSLQKGTKFPLSIEDSDFAISVWTVSKP